ncbi:MAG: hypothetical protein ACQEST_12885 [Bacteroidota bacterium]
MGRAMLIICSAALISLGIIGMSTTEMGQLLSQTNVNYAYETTVKNAAHTGIQIAMQEISKDSAWIENYGPENRDEPNVDNPVDDLFTYAEYLNDDWDENDYFDTDSVRIVGEAKLYHGTKTTSAKVTSVYLMRKFASLVPDFTGALQFPTGYKSLNADGNAHEINGKAEHCEEDKPPITVADDETKNDLDNNGDLNLDGDVALDESLDYEPTDELIKRLEDQATVVNSDYSENLGTADDPGVFFIDGNVRLTGQQSEGYGIMVIRNTADMEYEDEDGNTLDIRGNFEFNGLVIFENAELFDGRGTPTINGSVLVGDTEGDPDIDLDLGGNIEINYDCDGEKYAKVAANNIVDQNKYNRVVTYEDISN